MSRFLRTTADLVDRIFLWLHTASVRRSLEYACVALAAAGYLMHLAVISYSRSAPLAAEAAFGGLDQNFLHAVYTPFSFILFYEVLLLTLVIPRSHTSSIAKQYQIVSLIVVRRVFKDLGGFENLHAWADQPGVTLNLVFDMVTAVAMFVLAIGFERVSRAASHAADPPDLAGFITLKRCVSLLLGLALIGLAVVSVFDWAAGVLRAGALAPENVELDLFFFPQFFELMIFTDVFLLIISIAFYDRYELVFRNAGFVISTVLLRASLTSAPPYNNAIGLLAMVYGMVVLSVFVWYTRGVEQETAAPSEGTTAGA